MAKTRTGRTVPITVETARAVTQLINHRHQLWGDKVPVFCNSDGKKLESRSWNNRLEMYGRKLKIKVRPYDLRHCFAINFLRNGGQLFALQRTLGHTNLNMTKIYCNFTMDDLRREHLKASPLNTILSNRNRVRKIK